MLPFLFFNNLYITYVGDQNRFACIKLRGGIVNDALISRRASNIHVLRVVTIYRMTLNHCDNKHRLNIYIYRPTGRTRS